jgi:hypothetical protein
VNRDQFLARCPSLWHVAPAGAWERISRTGFRTADQLIGEATLDDEQRTALTTLPRRDPVRLDIGGDEVLLRDQAALYPKPDQPCSLGDGQDVQTWVRLLNQRVYFFADAASMQKMVDKYVARDGAQDVLVLSPMRLIDAVRPQIQLAAQSSTTVAKRKTSPKDRDPFVSIALFPDRRPSEVTVVGGLDDLSVVIRVQRFHADGRTEQLKP